MNSNTAFTILLVCVTCWLASFALMPVGGLNEQSDAYSPNLAIFMVVSTFATVAAIGLVAWAERRENKANQ